MEKVEASPVVPEGSIALWKDGDGAVVLIGLSLVEEDELIRGLRARIASPFTPPEDESVTIEITPDRDEPAPRLEQIDDEHSERVQDCEHRPQSCDDFASQRELQAGWNVRKRQAAHLQEAAIVDAALASTE